MQSDDREITLGAGKLLSLFFGLAALCGIFFGLGYMLGKNTAVPSNTSLIADTVAAPALTDAAKPSSVSYQTPPPATQPATDQQPQDDAGLSTEQPAATPAQALAAQGAAAERPAPEVARVAGTTTGYIVQIAAVSKQQDADALATALRKKQYPVHVSSIPSDNLFHVQVGPFGDIKEAETMKTRLQADGYNPIVKR